MPFIPIPNVAQVVIVYSLIGNKFTNTLYFEHVTGVTAVNMEDLLDAIELQLIATWKPTASNGVSISELVATDQSSATGPVVSKTPAAAINGTAGTTPLPLNVAFVVTTRTNLRGRSFRGRMYHGGLDELQVTGNNITPTARTAIETHYEDYTNVGLALDYSWVVASRYADNAPRATGIATPIIGIDTNEQVDTQRRRMP